MSNVSMVTSGTLVVPWTLRLSQKFGHGSNFMVQLLTKIEVTLDEKLWMKLVSILNLHKIIGYEFFTLRTIISW